jgi:hypothetical protein
MAGVMASAARSSTNLASHSSTASTHGAPDPWQPELAGFKYLLPMLLLNTNEMQPHGLVRRHCCITFRSKKFNNSRFACAKYHHYLTHLNNTPSNKGAITSSHHASDQPENDLSIRAVN